MKKILLSLLLLVSCGPAVVGVQTGAPAKEQAAARLAELSGLRQQADLTAARGELMFSQLAGSLGAKEQELFGRMVRETFDGDALYKDAVAYIEKNIDGARADAAIRSFGSPLAARMLRLELEATKPEHRGRLGEYVQGLNPKARSLRKRMELIERLDEATGASGHIVRMMSGFMVSSLEAAARLDPPDKRPSEREKEELISRMREKAAEDYKDAGFVLFLYAFRAVPDAELEEYVRMCETDEGRWFASVTRGALTEAFARAGVRMGKALSEVFKE